MAGLSGHDRLTSWFVKRGTALVVDLLSWALWVMALLFISSFIAIKAGGWLFDVWE